MVILSDCLTNKVDEGCLKVANNLAKRLKKEDEGITIISFDRKPDYSDVHMSLNKLFLNKHLYALLFKTKEPVLYIPFASNTTASCLRTFILSVYSGKRITVLFALRHKMNCVATFFLKLSGAKVIALSKDSYRFYKCAVKNQVFYLKTGIDTTRFIPVDEKRKKLLRAKYHIPTDKQVVLHVGHLKNGRNVDKLIGINKQFYIILVVSSVTKSESDNVIRAMLENRGSITIIDFYLPSIQEIYQLADVYLFPVQEIENCIDIPLSVMEAAACNLPIVTTEYGELATFKNQDAFIFIADLSPNSLNCALKEALSKTKVDNRQAVLEYDWKNSINNLQKIIKSGDKNDGKKSCFDRFGWLR